LLRYQRLYLLLTAAVPSGTQSRKEKRGAGKGRGGERGERDEERGAEAKRKESNERFT